MPKQKKRPSQRQKHALRATLPSASAKQQPQSAENGLKRKRPESERSERLSERHALRPSARQALGPERYVKAFPFKYSFYTIIPFIFPKNIPEPESDPSTCNKPGCSSGGKSGKIGRCDRGV